MTDDGRFRIVSSYTLAVYPCGIHAGQKSQLKRDLPIRDPTGTIVAIYQAGGVWQVLKGTVDEPDIVWLRQPDGRRHTWDDDELLDWLEVLTHDAN